MRSSAILRIILLLSQFSVDVGWAVPTTSAAGKRGDDSPTTNGPSCPEPAEGIVSKSSARTSNKQRSMEHTLPWMMASLAAAALAPGRMTCSAGAEPLAIYVATDGADGSPGTRAEPLASLGRARDAIRALKNKYGLPRGGVTVWLRGGVYYLRSTFELGKEDSGTESSPLVYRASDNMHSGAPIDQLRERLGRDRLQCLASE